MDTVKDYSSLTVKELKEIANKRGIYNVSKKLKSELILILQKYDEDKIRERIYKKKMEDIKKFKKERLAKGLQYEPYPVIRLDKDNYGYEVDGYILTRFEDKFHIMENYHCSCFNTDDNLSYMDLREHTYTLDDIINIAENNLSYGNPLEKNEDKALKTFYDSILLHKNELLTATDLIDYIVLENYYNF